MALEDRLQRWLGAGLLSPEQADRIRAFEHAHHHRPTFLYAVAGLGGLAIAVGLLSIVAANWDAIPGSAKIGVDLLLVAALGAGAWQLERRGPDWARETVLVVHYGLVLASIALIGQVYQLGGQVHEALLAWTVLTALSMSRTRSGLAATIWVLGLQITWVSWMVWLSDAWHSEELALATVYWPPLLCIAFGRLPGVGRVRPALAGVLQSLGWGELLLCATLGTFAFYGDTSREHWDQALPVMLVSVVLTLGIGLLLLRGLAERMLLLACLLLSHGPVIISTGDLPVPAAASFVLLWLLAAWSAHQDRNASLLNLATAMIGGRIVAIYFEVFGTLLDTGLGLLSGGVLTLLLVWLWARQRKQFAQELGQRNAGHGGGHGA